MATVKADAAVHTHAAELRKDLGLADLTFTQILFVVGLPWVGVAAKQGPSHVIYWLAAIGFFYLPSAAVVIHLNRAMPLEGGLYQWAKLGFNELTGFLVAWNLWLFAIGILMVTTFAMLLLLPWLNLAHGSLREFHPLRTALPVMSILSLNIAAKMGFGALGGFEYVAIHAGECRDADRTISRSVWLAAPVIGVMFILGTSSVLALVPFDRIDLIAPIPQVLALGFGGLGGLGPAAWIAPITIVILLCIRLAQASVMFTGITRLPMVAGWDGLLPAWFMRLHPRYATPTNSVVFVAAVTLGFSILGLLGVGKQEAFQLLWNASAIFYALTYLVMFAIPIVGSVRAPLWLKIASASGFLTTLAFVVLSILPIIQVQNRLTFALKISTVVVITNATGWAIFAARRGVSGGARTAS